MFNVTAEKLRAGSLKLQPPRTCRGYLLAAPALGSSLVLFRDEDASRMVTTKVTRVMSSGDVWFVETENSLYRVTVHGKVVYSAEHASLIPVAPREIAYSEDFPAQAEPESNTAV